MPPRHGPWARPADRTSGSGDYVLLVQDPSQDGAPVPVLLDQARQQVQGTRSSRLGPTGLQQETMEKKARWPGTTSTSRTRAAVGVDFCGRQGHGSAWRLQDPGRSL